MIDLLWWLFQYVIFAAVFALALFGHNMTLRFRVAGFVIGFGGLVWLLLQAIGPNFFTVRF